MILVDKRRGSGDLLLTLPPHGIEVHETQMDAADVAFVGRGVNGVPVPIGIELKRLDDIVQCIEDGRFSGDQLPKLVKEGYDLVWLVIEGQWKYENHDGTLIVPRSGGWEPFRLGSSSRVWKAHDVEAYFLTMQLRGGVIFHRTQNRGQTIWWLATLYKWWTEKNFDQHQGHLAFHRPRPDKALLVRPSLTRRMAKEVDGIGWEKSQAVEEHFQTPQIMCNASESEWKKIPGVGKTIAERTVKQMRGWQ